MSTIKDIESTFKIKYEMKYLFLGFLVIIGLAIVFIHIIMFITGEEKYMGTTSAVLLGSSSCLLLFTILSNHRNVEVRRFKLLFVGLTLWFFGEFTYSFYEIVLDTEAPYPGLGEIFYIAGFPPLILFTYRSFKTINKDGIIKRNLIILVFTLAFIAPVTSTIIIFSQEVDFQSQWPDIVISTNNTYCDGFLLALTILIITKLPRNNPYIYHWILFASFMILTIVTDFFYLHLAVVDEEFLLKTELIWEGMWAFAYLCILASIFWYYKLIRILRGDTNLMTNDYVKKYQNNISANYKDEIEKDQLHTENIQDFDLVKNRIDEIIESANHDITILFSNMDTLMKKEIQSILKILKKKNRPNVLVRILFPLNVDDSIINSYKEIAKVRTFESKQKSSEIIIVSDYSKELLVLTIDPIYNDKGTKYAITYSNNEDLVYTQATTFEKLWLIQTVTKLEVR